MSLFLSLGHGFPRLAEQLERQGYTWTDPLVLLTLQQHAEAIHRLLGAGLLTMKEALRAQSRLAKIIRKNAIPKEQADGSRK